MNYFIYTSRHLTPHGRYELNKLTSLPMCGFIAQLVEHRTGIAEVTGSNPVEALIFFRLLLSNCLNWNLLRWSFFTLIYHRSSHTNYFIYTSPQNGFCRYIFTNKVTLWASSYSACVVYTKTIIHLSVGEIGGFLPPVRWIIVNYSVVSWKNFNCV